MLHTLIVAYKQLKNVSYDLTASRDAKLAISKQQFRNVAFSEHFWLLNRGLVLSQNLA